MPYKCTRGLYYRQRVACINENFIDSSSIQIFKLNWNQLYLHMNGKKKDWSLLALTGHNLTQNPRDLVLTVSVLLIVCCHPPLQLLVCAMGPPGGGRNNITGRFTRHMNIVSIESFDDSAMTKIFSAFADWHFSKGFDSIFGRLGKVCVKYQSYVKHVREQNCNENIQCIDILNYLNAFHLNAHRGILDIIKKNVWITEVLTFLWCFTIKMVLYHNNQYSYKYARPYQFSPADLDQSLQSVIATPPNAKLTAYILVNC